VTVSNVSQNADGTVTAKFTSTTALPNATVTASYQGVPINGPQPIPFVAVPVPPTATLSMSSTVIHTDCDAVTPVTATVVVRDAAANPVPGVEVTFSLGTTVLGKVTTDPQGTARQVVGAAGVLHATTVVAGKSVEASGSPVTITAQTTPCPVLKLTVTAPVAGAVLPTGTPKFAGTSDPGATVTVREGTKVLCTAVADAQGAWSCTPVTPLADGPHALVVDAVKGTLTAQAQVSVTVNSQLYAGAAVAVVIPVVNRGGTQTVGGSGWQPGEKVTLTVNSTPISLGTVTAKADGTLPTKTFTVPTTFELGTHTVVAVGEVSGTRQATFQVIAAATGNTDGGGGSTVPTGGSVAGFPWGVLLAVAAWSVGLIVLVSRRRSVR